MPHRAEPVSKVVDGVAAVVAASTLTGLLQQVSLLVAIVASVMSIIWFVIRIRDRIKYGPLK